MPTWPVTPLPNSISAAGITDPLIVHRVDEGYERRRSRYSRGTRLYQLDYTVQHHHVVLFQDFVEREIRTGVLSFAWTYSQPHTIATIDFLATTIVDTVAAHGFQTGDQVEISGTTNYNGVHTITRDSAVRFTLNGVTGFPTEERGYAARYFPVMLLRLPEGRWQPPEKLKGPPRDAQGWFRFSVTLEEGF